MNVSATVRRFINIRKSWRQHVSTVMRSSAGLTNRYKVTWGLRTYVYFTFSRIINCNTNGIPCRCVILMWLCISDCETWWWPHDGWNMLSSWLSYVNKSMYCRADVHFIVFYLLALRDAFCKVEVALLSAARCTKLVTVRGEANHLTHAATVYFVCLLQNETGGPNRFIDPRLQPDF